MLLGGVAIWAITEPTPLTDDDFASSGMWETLLLGVICGAFYGGALSLAQTKGQSQRNILHKTATTCGIGAAGGVIGFIFGNAIYSLMLGLAGGSQVYEGGGGGVFSFALMLIGRSSGWALLGAAIGLALGISTSSTRKMVNGLIGGVLGGAAGGLAFELMSWMGLAGAFFITGPLLRFISFCVTGASIGFFISLVEELRTQAWVTKLAGRNEGQRYDIYQDRTVIGRSEFADIPVFTDPGVSAEHAAITAIDGRYEIVGLTQGMGISVNDSFVSSAQLTDGDYFNVGSVRFLFSEKGGQAFPVHTPAQSQQPQRTTIPVGENICPYCGEKKDASGNCSCSVPDTPSKPQAPAPVQQANGEKTVQSSPFGASPQSEATSADTLMGISGLYSGQKFNVKPGETTIGRDSVKDISLSMDNTVSRNHAVISSSGSVATIKDAGSSNGTHVNGARITSTPINSGDRIKIGASEFTYTKGAD